MSEVLTPYFGLSICSSRQKAHHHLWHCPKQAATGQGQLPSLRGKMLGKQGLISVDPWHHGPLPTAVPCYSKSPSTENAPSSLRGAKWEGAHPSFYFNQPTNARLVEVIFFQWSNFGVIWSKHYKFKHLYYCLARLLNLRTLQVANLNIKRSLVIGRPANCSVGRHDLGEAPVDWTSKNMDTSMTSLWQKHRYSTIIELLHLFNNTRMRD